MTNQTSEQKPQKKSYTGGCHCGKVRFRAEAAIDSVVACNCSMCGRAGTLLVFVPVADFTLLSGADDLQSYKFNKHIIDHVFCKTCGVKSFAKGESPQGEMRALNVRCLDDVDIETFKVQHFDGKNR